MHKVNYFPQSQADLPPPERDEYRAIEVPETIEGVVDGRTVRLKYRRLLPCLAALARRPNGSPACPRSRTARAWCRGKFPWIHLNLT